VPFPISLDGQSLTIEALGDLADGHRPTGGAQVALVPQDCLAEVDEYRAVIERLNASDTPHYGISTGFGSLCHTRVPEDQREQLQANLLRSHSVGVGPAVPDEVVRLMLALKVNSLAKGYSGVRREVVGRLLAMLNMDILPLVPVQGSVGASGDLAPLSHLALPLIGEGMVRHCGTARPAAEVLAELGLAPLKLAAKEGLALINGTQFMSAYGTLVAHRARRLLATADIAAALTWEALLASQSPLHERLFHVRPHKGADASARRIRALIRGSGLLASRNKPDSQQDPYSLRCAPQVHGASRDALAHVAAVLETEINSTTDNPIAFLDGRVASGGNFHGQPLALALDYAAIAIAELGSISERRTYLLEGGRDGLPPMLVKDSGLHSGLMICQYTAAALVSENKVLCHPASVDSVPTCNGQEDHVSMGSISARKALSVVENVERILAIELLCAAQAIDLRAPLRPGRGTAAAHAEIRRHVATAIEDRSYAQDIEALTGLVRSGALAAAAEEM
jgi:histidine ammonia-lyase